MSGLERFRRQSHQEGRIGEQRCETGRVRVTLRSCSDTLRAYLHDTMLTTNCSGQNVSVILNQDPPRHCWHPGWVILCVCGGCCPGHCGDEAAPLAPPKARSPLSHDHHRYPQTLPSVPWLRIALGEAHFTRSLPIGSHQEMMI